MYAESSTALSNAVNTFGLSESTGAAASSPAAPARKFLRFTAPPLICGHGRGDRIQERRLPLHQGRLPVLGRDAARELEAGLDVAVTAALEYDHPGHDRIIEEEL